MRNKNFINCSFHFNFISLTVPFLSFITSTLKVPWNILLIQIQRTHNKSSLSIFSVMISYIHCFQFKLLLLFLLILICAKFSLYYYWFLYNFLVTWSPWIGAWEVIALRATDCVSINNFIIWFFRIKCDNTDPILGASCINIRVAWKKCVPWK